MLLSELGLDEPDACLGALASHVVGPDGGLNLADVGFVEEHHAESALSDASTDAQRQSA